MYDDSGNDEPKIDRINLILAGSHVVVRLRSLIFQKRNWDWLLVPIARVKVPAQPPFLVGTSFGALGLQSKIRVNSCFGYYFTGKEESETDSSVVIILELRADATEGEIIGALGGFASAEISLSQMHWLHSRRPSRNKEALLTSGGTNLMWTQTKDGRSCSVQSTRYADGRRRYWDLKFDHPHSSISYENTGSDLN